MQKQNVEIVEKLPSGKLIVKIENQVQKPGTNEFNTIVKFALADENGLINIVDLNGNLLGFQFFDIYTLNETGEIVIGLKKTGKEYNERVLSHFDLSDTQWKAIEVPGGPFNIGPYAKQYYEYIRPTKTVDDIVPQSYSYNFGLINKEGVLVIYPSYDHIEFGNEATCIVGRLGFEDLVFGYIDINTGKLITPICFDKASKFYDNRAVVKYNRKYGYIDRNKVIVNPKNNEEYAANLYPRFFRANDFNNGVAIAGFSQGTHFTQASYAEIDKTGIISIVPEKGLHLIKKRIK